MNNRYNLNKNLAQMLKGGVIMDVTNVEQAKIAQEAGAVAVMALERVPADIRREGGVARMSDPKMIREIKEAVSIPVMAKARIGHFVEAQILQAIGIDYIDESEVLTPADDENHIYKQDFDIPFVCGARNLGEALRRIGEGASMIRTKGEAGTGNVIEAVRHFRTMQKDINRVKSATSSELMHITKEMGAPFDLVCYVHEHGKLPGLHAARRVRGSHRPGGPRQLQRGHAVRRELGRQALCRAHELLHLRAVLQQGAVRSGGHRLSGRYLDLDRGAGGC